MPFVQPPVFSLSRRAQSVRHAIRGIVIMVSSQHNAWIHAVATLLVIVAAIFFRVSAVEWGLLICAMMAVWTAEGLNTALELLCDVASPEFHPLIEKAKDVAAGAVFLSALGAAALGGVIFLPEVYKLLAG